MDDRLDLLSCLAGLNPSSTQVTLQSANVATAAAAPGWIQPVQGAADHQVVAVGRAQVAKFVA